jgi:hypothetical protein
MVDLGWIDAVGVRLGTLRARDPRRACRAVVAEGVEDERDRDRVVLDVAVVDLATRTDRLDAAVAVVALALQVRGRAGTLASVAEVMTEYGRWPGVSPLLSAARKREPGICWRCAGGHGTLQIAAPRGKPWLLGASPMTSPTRKRTSRHHLSAQRGGRPPWLTPITLTGRSDLAAIFRIDATTYSAWIWRSPKPAFGR